MTADKRALHARVEKAVLAECQRVGPGMVKPAELVHRFMGKGASEATLHRWVAAVLASPAPGQAFARTVKRAAAQRAAKAADSAAAAKAAAADVMAELPATVKIEHVATAGAIPVIERLNQCLSVADQLMRYARTETGGVRNSKLLLQASEHLRRCLETAARITEALMDAEQIELIHEETFRAIEAESPATAERIVARLRQLNASWMPRGAG